MLERASGCLENAGQRLLRDSSGPIRSRKSLHPHFWSYKPADSDHSLRSSTLPNVSDGRSPRFSGSSQHSSSATEDANSPVLDFLYPPRTRDFAVSWLIRPGRRVALRKRRQLTPSLARPYTSEAVHLLEDIPKPFSGVGLGVFHGQDDKERETAELLKVLGANSLPDYDKAWRLYSKSGQGPELLSNLLLYLSNSERRVDRRRMRRLFDRIPVNDRPAEAYVHMIKSLLRSGDYEDVGSICKEAMARGVGTQSWTIAFAFFVETRRWEEALALWEFRPVEFEHDPSHAAVSQFHFSSELPRLVLAFAEHTKENSERIGIHGAPSLAQFLLTCLFKSPDVMHNMAIETILQLNQAFKRLDLLKPTHYFNAIETLLSAEVRSTAMKSLVVYRNFRFLLPDRSPSQKTLRKILTMLASFEVSQGVLYLLDEYASFYGKPDIAAYREALQAFSRVGDVEHVYEVFDRLIRDHGNPQSRRLVNPLLYVHAKSGRVEDTLREFRRISEEFNMQPDTVCWNIVLLAHANAWDIEGAFRTFQRMLDTGIEPDSHSFGTLMGLCANKGDLDGVLYLFTAAKGRQVKITTPLIDTIVEACCNNQKLEDAETVAEACLKLNVTGSRVRMWNMLLWSYACRADLISMSRIQSRMQAAGIQPDSMTYAALMLSLVVIGRPDSARRLLRSLHQSHRMHATEFHYAIVLFGYVKARNRDMVHIIYREIAERFEKPGISSRLLAFKSVIERDLQLMKEGRRSGDGAKPRLAKSEAFLAETIAEFDMNGLLSKHQQHGSTKLSIKEAFPSMYYEYIITAYGVAGAMDRVKELFDEYNTVVPALSPNEADQAPPLRLLSSLMFAHLKAGQYTKVEDCWKLALQRALEVSRRPPVESWIPTTKSPKEAVQQPPQPSLPNSNRHQGALVLGSPTRLIDDADAAASILQSRRFILSRCLSLYMRSLAYRNQTRKIADVILEIESAGFCLTTHNWSTYVQMLTTSERSSDQFKAFTIFEEKFMPNFPGWKALRKGFGVRPEGVPATIDEVEDPRRGHLRGYLGKSGRKIWSKIQPDFMQPTYITMIYLSSALLDFRERSIVDGGAELRALYSAAPQTIEVIADMPYLRDKFQGVLLRRREERGDKTATMEPYEYFVWTGGVLGVEGQCRIVTESGDLETLDEEGEAITKADSPSFTSEQAAENDNTSDSLEGASEPVDGEIPWTLVGSAEAMETPRKTLASEDEQDMEAETLLRRRSRNLDMDVSRQDGSVAFDKGQRWVDILSLVRSERGLRDKQPIDKGMERKSVSNQSSATDGSEASTIGSDS
ncbi:translation regulator (Cya5), putative [Paecilomyces variotii No. 5]|uniref:Translation regulator (Cya5), putative n=1 Tax=Byssochlamys spectabilis (strain No. 5 / NBRC 109023) TaxID=1356009 RepID=V5FVV4_BYSSN|nr:translation regulator (Cya5), putative [Paecilomyces variotii No. 5]